MKLIKKIFFIPILPIILFLVAGQLLTIDTIHCQILETNCNPELYKKLEILKGQSLFYINFDKKLSEDEFKSETMLLQKYKKQFPGTVFLTFTEEKILYELEIEGSKMFVSEFGNILQNNQNLEDIVLVDWGSELNNEIHSKIKIILESVDDTDLKIKKITRESDERIIIKITGYPKVIIDEEAIIKKLDILDKLLNSREIKEYEDPIKEIDLRFNLPVLRTAQ